MKVVKVIPCFVLFLRPFWWGHDKNGDTIRKDRRIESAELWPFFDRLEDPHESAKELEELKQKFPSPAEDLQRVERDFTAFVESARGETTSPGFREWVGGERITLAIVFTDVVGSTALGEELKDEPMTAVRRLHFAQSRALIEQYQGREIKTIGDSFMVAFRSVEQALGYAKALQDNPGDIRVQIRAGIHVGPMSVDEGDVFGGAVNFAARVVGSITGPEIWLSDRAKEDLDSNRSVRHAHLKWERHDGVQMKGFSSSFVLWSLLRDDGVREGLRSGAVV